MITSCNDFAVSISNIVKTKRSLNSQAVLFLLSLVPKFKRIRKRYSMQFIFCKHFQKFDAETLVFLYEKNEIADLYGLIRRISKESEN
jgi:hypothetical protein